MQKFCMLLSVGPARTCEPTGSECSSDMTTNCCSKYCLWFPGENTGTCQDRPGESQEEYQEEYQDD